MFSPISSDFQASFKLALVSDIKQLMWGEGEAWKGRQIDKYDKTKLSPSISAARRGGLGAAASTNS